MATKAKNRLFLTGFCLLFLLVFLCSFGLGKYPVHPNQLFHVLFSKLLGLDQTWPNQVELVIFKIRLPRILAASLIGAGLAAAGAVYQGLFRNPMVSPDILGASSGAGLGAAMSLVLSTSYLLVSINAFIFSFAAVILAYFISTRVKQNPTLGMVLSGIMIGSLCSAGTSFIKLIADPNNTLPAITYWLMGSLASVTSRDILYGGIPLSLGLIGLLLLRWKLNLLTMGEDEARAMGVNTRVMRLIVVILATLLTAASVSIGGMIGWVGLVIPHVARMLVGYDYRIMLPSSMLLGASFLVVVDTFARTMSTVEIPLGILTSFLGAPFFLYLILRKGRRI